MKNRKIILFSFIFLFSLILAGTSIKSEKSKANDEKKENKKTIREEKTSKETPEDTSEDMKEETETTLDEAKEEKEEEIIITDAITEVFDEIIIEPTIKPTINPTIEPTIRPTIKPTIEATIKPTIKPTIEPTINENEKDNKEPEITSILYDLQNNKTYLNETGYFIGNMGGKEIYVTNRTFSCYLDDDIDFSNINLSYMNQLSQEEWENYSYDMKMCYLNQIKDISLEILGINKEDNTSTDIHMVNDEEMEALHGTVVLGLQTPNGIYLNINYLNDFKIIKNALLHETRHCWQCLKFNKVFLGPEYLNVEIDYHDFLFGMNPDPEKLVITKNNEEYEKCKNMNSSYYYYSDKNSDEPLVEKDANNYARIMGIIWEK